MAVEARHLDHRFPSQMPQLISNSGDFIGAKQGGTNMYDTMTMAHMEYGALPTRIMPHHEMIFPGYHQSVVCDRTNTLPVKSVESGLTTFADNSALGAARKQARDSVDYACGVDTGLAIPRKTRVLSVDQDISLDIHRQQSELDQIIAQHTQRMRMEIEEKVRQQSKELLGVVQQGIVRKLREKDEEIQRVGKLNFVLQERIKTLCIENQLLRGLAQTSEAAANSLRSNLEQVLAVANATEDRNINNCSGPAVAVEDDAESCCGSSGDQLGPSQEEREAPERLIRACRGCGEKEACVLLLPCRHLCLCTGCGSASHGCPVCGSVMTGTVHVNMS